MNDLNAEQYEQLWADGATERNTMVRLRDYYDGRHDIVGSGRTYTDGSAKSEVVSNFIKYAVDLYVGAMSDTYNITALEMADDEGDNQSPEFYREIGTLNDFDTADITTRRDAFIYGWGIELHEFIDGQVVISPRNPLNWRRIYDADGLLIGIITTSVIDKGGFYQGEMLKDNLTIMVVYTDSLIRTFHKTRGLNDGRWFTPDGFEDTKHFYGQVPATIYRINESMETHITDDVIGLQNEYNEIDSASGDQVKDESDGLLALVGFSPKDVQDNAETIKQWKLLGLPEGGNAFYINKGTDTNRVTQRLTRTRDNLFMSLSVPDINEIVGATGATSGIALQLKFKPMADKAKSMIAHIRASVRDRIDLINAVMEKSKGDYIHDVQINIAFNLPRNTVEEWQNVGNLEGIVSHRKQLELLSDVTDPDQEERRLEREGEIQRFDTMQTGTDAEVKANKDAAITAGAEAIQPQIASVIDSIADAVLAETLRRQGSGA